MEKMDSTQECQHSKAFGPTALMSSPAKHPWVCRLCGEEGYEVRGSFSSEEMSEFDTLLVKKSRGGFRRV